MKVTYSVAKDVVVYTETALVTTFRVYNHMGFPVKEFETYDEAWKYADMLNNTNFENLYPV